MVEDDDKMWRRLINSYANDVDTTGRGPSELEMITTALMPEPEDEDVFFVQKIITEVYIFTNRKGQSFGDHTFQDMVILGDMTKDKLSTLLERQKAKREKQKGS